MSPFTVTKPINSTTCQIQDDKDPSVVKTVRRNLLVEVYPKEESLPAMIEEYKPHDKRHDDFFEPFLEQRFGKKNSFTEPLAEDSILFPIRPLPSAAAISLDNCGIVTSSDSGVGSPEIFSPTLPITPENLPQHSQETANEQPSTSAATRPLTPIQQFLRNSRKAKPKEPKYYRPQPNDPSSQSAIRTLTRQGYKL